LINYLGTHLAQQFDNLTVKAVPCIHNEDFYSPRLIQVEFYISQTKADNHAVREAACACIAELGTKVCELLLPAVIL